MAEFKFNPADPSPLKVKITYYGKLQAAYIYTLWEGDSNVIVQRHEGNNLNPQDDVYELPLPTADHNGRIIEVRSSFIGTYPETHPDYQIDVEVFQGDALLGTDTDSGKLDDKVQQAVSYIILTT